MAARPDLDNKLDQIAELPVGGRIKLDPWEDRVEMLKATLVSIVSTRDKNPFGVSPFFPRLTRYGTIGTPANAAAAQNTGASPQQP